MYKLHLQKLRSTKHRVVMVAENGKLVMAGEAINDRRDALRIRNHIYDVSLDGFEKGADLPASHRFVKNSGPKRKSK